ncbi:MAG: aminotransferase class I/II-fold pyridoxal phosphate-dependent enzyme [Actinobacteria bacterium]|nr:aminotransferase class I/II-fold pyridoxal phosphate-dependent enzyme [Actinomycetota bacterium]
MHLAPFALERYFARYEFASRYLLCASDCDGPSLHALLAQADEETTALWQSLTLGYTESQGLPILRQEIANLYTPESPLLSPDDVLVVVPEEGILLTMLALVKPGDHVISTFPGYQSLYEVARGLGADLSFWRPREEEGWRFATEDLSTLLRPGSTRLVVCNFPHNPTGYLPPPATFRRIVDLTRRAGAVLFSDEMYRGLELPGYSTLPSAVELSSGAIVLSGMSKTYGLPGLRLGWLVCRDTSILQICASLKDYTTICTPAPSEILALAALRGRNQLLPAHRERVIYNLHLLAEFCARRPDLFQLIPPRAGTVCFPRLRCAVGAAQLCHETAHRAAILLLPSTVYGYGDSHVRIGLGRVTFPDALAAFDEYLGAGGP